MSASSSASGPAPPRRKRTRDAALGAESTLIAPRGASFGSLPTDVLALVFAFAPFAARLRTISRVCKRWHTAALRSVTRLNLARLNERMAADILPLFPALTALSVSASPVAASLTALRELKLVSSSSFAMDPNPLLAAHFPALTSLSLSRGKYSDLLESGKGDEWARLEAFLSRHSAGIRSLAINAPGALACAAKVSWPALRSLKVEMADGVLPLLHPLTNLHRLAVRCLCADFATDLLALPDHCRTALTALHVTVRRNARMEAWVRGLPRLAQLAWDPSPEPPRMQSQLTTVLLRPQWEADLTAYVRMTKLVLLPKQALLPDLSGGRHSLRHVAIGSAHAPFDVTEAIMLASYVIRELPLLRSLCLSVRRMKTVGAAADLKGLVRLAHQRGVAKLKIVGSFPALRLSDPSGWVDVVLSKCH